MLCDWQASGSLHSSPHSSIWNSLHRVCFHSRRCQQKRTTCVWTWSRFFSGRSPLLSSHICPKRQHDLIVFICLDFMCILCTVMYSLFVIIICTVLFWGHCPSELKKYYFFHLHLSNTLLLIYTFNKITIIATAWLFVLFNNFNFFFSGFCSICPLLLS